MDRANQDNRWLRDVLGDIEVEMSSGEMRVRDEHGLYRLLDEDEEADVLSRQNARDGEAHDEGGGIVACAPRCSTSHRLQYTEAALRDSERQHFAACAGEEFWQRRAERAEAALFVIGLAVLVIAGTWIVAKF